MLPTVKRKTLEIPHTLAALAAAVCLIIAFATDFSSREDSLRAQIDQTETAELMARHMGATRDEPSSGSDTPRRGTGDGSAPSSSVSSGLLNWFGLPFQGH